MGTMHLLDDRTANDSLENVFNISQCERSSNDLMFLAIGVPIPIFSIIVNFAVLLAVTIQRQTLRRHNYVFSSVSSTLASNMVYTILSVWTTIANYLKIIENSLEETPHDNVSEKFWILRNGAIICLLLAMCGNIGSLIYVLMDSTYFVRKTIDKRTVEQTNRFIATTGEKSSLRFRLTKRRKAHLLIGLSWSVPLLLVLISAFSNWNCARECCGPGKYTRDPCPLEAGCSRFWPPMTHTFLGVFLGLWIVEVIFLLWLIGSTYLKFLRVTVTANVENHSSDDIADVTKTNEQIFSVENQQNLSKDPTAPYEASNKTAGTNGSPERKKTLSTSSDSQTKKTQKRRLVGLNFTKKLNSKVKSMTSLTLIFLVFTLPVMLSIIVDFSTGSPMPGKDIFRVTSELSTYLYTVVCPLILLKFMPRLKLSVVLCFYNCSKKCGL